MKDRLKKIWRENKSLFLFISLMLVFRSAVADWNEVPTGSMKPTIVEGDRILVNKMAYDIRIPFTHISLVKMSDPQRSDIIIFDSAVSDKKLVKRVVGIPGDIISMQDNVLFINGEKLTYQASDTPHYKEENSSIIIENLLGIEHKIKINPQGSRLSSFSAVKVPENQYLAMGDNRDNSADSRVIGFIPREEIVGKTNSVVISLNYNNYYLPRSERFLHTL